LSLPDQLKRQAVGACADSLQCQPRLPLSASGTNAVCVFKF
jgi:hypothetical protein